MEVSRVIPGSLAKTELTPELIAKASRIADDCDAEIIQFNQPVSARPRNGGHWRQSDVPETSQGWMIPDTYELETQSTRRWRHARTESVGRGVEERILRELSV